MEKALLRNGGGRAWRAWKAGQLEEVMKDLAFASPRMEVLHAELTSDLELVYGLQMPVPLAPRNGVLGLADAAVFRLAFRESWTWESPPGWGELLSIGVEKHQAAFSSGTWLTGIPLTYLAPW